MVDCGATALFIGEKFVQKNRIHMYRLQREVPLYNIDSLKNRAGKITCFARLQMVVGEVEEWREFLITDLGPEDIKSERCEGPGSPRFQVEKMAANWMQ